MRNLIFAFFVVPFLSGCAEQNNRIQPLSLISDLEINHFSDSTFFSSIMCFQVYEGEIYASDQKRCQIFCLDTGLRLIRTIAQKGHAPNELGYIEQFAIDQRTIYIGDAHKMKIVLFDAAGGYLGQQDTKGKIPLNNRFFATEGDTYYTYPLEDSKSSLTAYEEAAQVMINFGEITDFETPYRTRKMNIRDVSRYNNTIISVPKSIPIVEFYNQSDKTLTYRFDLLDIPVVKKRYHEAISDPLAKNENAFYYIHSDIFLLKDRLYILYPGKAETEMPYKLYSTIIELRITDEHLEWVGQYDLKNDFVTSFCVTDDYVYGFVPKYSSIRRYPLNR